MIFFLVRYFRLWETRSSISCPVYSIFSQRCHVASCLGILLRRRKDKNVRFVRNNKRPRSDDFHENAIARKARRLENWRKNFETLHCKYNNETIFSSCREMILDYLFLSWLFTLSRDTYETSDIYRVSGFKDLPVSFCDEH